MPPAAVVDPATIDTSRVLYDLEAIRHANPQRFEMEQLTAIVHMDTEAGLIIGYKDVRPDEFWVRGHLPDYPLMPGVLMCEAAAQVFSYHTQRHDLSGAQLVGFGGLDKVRFRGVVKPGDRLVIACQLMKFRRGRLVHADFQLFVGTTLVCEGSLLGVALPVDALK